jgi:hypothetical protein
MPNARSQFGRHPQLAGLPENWWLLHCSIPHTVSRLAFGSDALGRVRTCNLRIRSPLLYPVALRAPRRVGNRTSRSEKTEAIGYLRSPPFELGAAALRNRTWRC